MPKFGGGREDFLHQELQTVMTAMIEDLSLDAKLAAREKSGIHDS
jgi:hypothetical protein